MQCFLHLSPTGKSEMASCRKQLAFLSAVIHTSTCELLQPVLLSVSTKEESRKKGLCTTEVCSQAGHESHRYTKKAGLSLRTSLKIQEKRFFFLLLIITVDITMIVLPILFLNPIIFAVIFTIIVIYMIGILFLLLFVTLPPEQPQ